MDPSESGTSLQSMIRNARGGLSQRAVGELLGCSAQHIAKLEKDGTPTLEMLIAMHRVLVVDGSGDQLGNALADWLIAWLGSHKHVPGRDALAGAVDELRDGRRRKPKRARRPLETLAPFPGDDELTIVLGDRRELPAKSAADCFIFSGSAVDAIGLPLLGSVLEDAVIVPDTVFAWMPEAYLREQPLIAERNLLILGSPAANWAARICNQRAVFPFAIDKYLVDNDDLFRHKPQMQVEAFAAAFWEIARGHEGGKEPSPYSGPELRLPSEDLEKARLLARRVLSGSTAKVIMNAFRSSGIRDPADGFVHATRTHYANDFGVVTMARNPWAASDRYKAIICAGLHGPETVGALRELCSRPKELFGSRPLGTVLEFHLNTSLNRPDRIRGLVANPRHTNIPDMTFSAPCKRR